MKLMNNQFTLKSFGKSTYHEKVFNINRHSARIINECLRAETSAGTASPFQKPAYQQQIPGIGQEIQHRKKDDPKASSRNEKNEEGSAKSPE